MLVLYQLESVLATYLLLVSVAKPNTFKPICCVRNIFKGPVNGEQQPVGADDQECLQKGRCVEVAGGCQEEGALEVVSEMKIFQILPFTTYR
jgi:hypothetical protein